MNNVSSVEVINPPITACPWGTGTRSPHQPERHRQHPKIIAKVVIRIGRRRLNPPGQGLGPRHSTVPQNVCVVDQQDAVLRHQSINMMMPIMEMTESALPHTRSANTAQ